MTVLTWGVWSFFMARNRTFGTASKRVGQRVWRMDSNNSHSSAEGNVLIKILMIIGPPKKTSVKLKWGLTMMQYGLIVEGRQVACHR